MESKEFKKMFDLTARSFGFISAFGGWYKESVECVEVLQLQKSNFGKYFQLNVKIFIQGAFGRNYIVNKELINSSIGHVNESETQKYKNTFNLEIAIDNAERNDNLKALFNEHIVPFTEKALTKNGIKELFNKKKIFLLPAIKEVIGCKD